jgi:hypothetical protein
MRTKIDDVKNDIITAAELHATFKIYLLGKAFGPCSAAFLSYHSIGVNKRIIPCTKFVWVFAIIFALGPQLVLKVLLFWHHFYHVELLTILSCALI